MADIIPLLRRAHYNSVLERKVAQHGYSSAVIPLRNETRGPERSWFTNTGFPDDYRPFEMPQFDKAA